MTLAITGAAYAILEQVSPERKIVRSYVPIIIVEGGDHLPLGTGKGMLKFDAPEPAFDRAASFAEKETGQIFTQIQCVEFPFSDPDLRDEFADESER